MNFGWFLVLVKYWLLTALEADQEEGSLQLCILPREYTDPYTPWEDTESYSYYDML